MSEVLGQLLAHLLDGQDEIDHACVDGASGHGVVLGLGLLLGHDQAAGGLDLLESEGAVGAGAREDDANGLVRFILGQGAEEGVDGQVHADVRRGLDEVQDSVQDGDVLLGRTEVYCARLDLHAVLDILDGKLGMLLYQGPHHACAIRGPVLNHDESHVQIAPVHAQKAPAVPPARRPRRLRPPPGRGPFRVSLPARLQAAVSGSTVASPGCPVLSSASSTASALSRGFSRLGLALGMFVSSFLQPCLKLQTT